MAVTFRRQPETKSCFQQCFFKVLVLFFKNVCPPLAHLCAILQVHDRSPLRHEVSACALHIPLQGAVILLAPGEGIEGRDLLPCFVVGERERVRVLVLKEALEVPFSQLGGILHGKGIKAIFLLLHVSFPKHALQVAHFGAAVCVAGTQEAEDGGCDDDTPAQNLQTYSQHMNQWSLLLL